MKQKANKYHDGRAEWRLNFLTGVLSRTENGITTYPDQLKPECVAVLNIFRNRRAAKSRRKYYPVTKLI